MSRDCGRVVRWAGVGLLSFGCGPDLYLMTEEHDRVKGSDWVYTGGGCFEISRNGGSGTGGGDAYAQFSLGVEEGEAHVRVIEGGEVTVDERYDEVFLESGKKERVLMHFADGRTRRFTFWGGPECVEPLEPDEEAIASLLEPRDAGVD